MLIVLTSSSGPRRYSELAAGLPRIPTNVLATRLKELQAAGIIRRAPRSRVLVYELTDYGREARTDPAGARGVGFKTLDDPRGADHHAGFDDDRSAYSLPAARGNGARDGLRGALRHGRAAHRGRRHPGSR